MSAVNIESILKRNDELNRQLFSPYNPYTGEGSPIEREKLYLTETEFIYIPSYLYATRVFQDIVKAGNAQRFARSKNLDYQTFIGFLNSVRVEHDFEYWAATCCEIKDKTSGRYIKFIMRKPQLKLLKYLIDDYFAGIPIRIVVLKARQWGGSTLVEMFYAWIQIWQKENWNSVIVAHQLDPAKTIRAMYSNMAEHHPVSVRPVRFRAFEGSTSNKQLVDRGSIVCVGSMERPDALRSNDIKLAHLSEVGLWRTTKGKKPEDVITSITSSIPSDPYTAIVLESTAKGIGTYFHNTWINAVKGENAYRAVFVAWYEIDIYYKRFRSQQQKIDFIRSMTENEMYMFNLGATLEGIHWYREKRKEYTSDWQMRQEFPSTAEEAFITSGRTAHNLQHVLSMEPFTKPPLYIGELTADAEYGREAINSSLAFSPRDNGTLKLWALPDKTQKISDRYVVSMDIGGRSDGADWTVISVIDRYWLIEGGVEECIGTYRFHLDQDLAVWKAVQLARFFNNALLAIESNSLDDKEQEGDHSLTILDEVKDYYDNLYFRDDPQKIKEGLPIRYGFHTNRATKTDLVNQMNKRLRESGYIEYDIDALNEIRTYELKPDGSYGAVDGQHDDIYMSRAIGLKVSSKMPQPRLIIESQHVSHYADRPRGMSDF